jgi:hypothetical protein
VEIVGYQNEMLGDHQEDEWLPLTEQFGASGADGLRMSDRN